MFFAELPPHSSATAIGWILGGLAALGAALAGASVAIRHLAGVRPPPAERTIADQPLRVTPEPAYLERREWERDMAAMDRRMTAVEERMDHEIAATRREIEAMSTAVREDIRAVHSRIDDLPGQIITILRNTGAIHTHGEKGQ